MPLDSTTATVVALGVAGFALLLAVALAVRLGRVERACAALASAGLSSVPGVVASAVSSDEPWHDVAALRAELAQVRLDLGTALRHVAVVRYDAFDDLAGRLSFSAALLDDAGDGVVLSSINGRSETRTYAKGVTGGDSSHPLSPEEREAIARARPEPAPPGRLRAAG